MKRVLQTLLVGLLSLCGLSQAVAEQQRPVQSHSTTTFRFGYILEKLGVPRLTRPAPRQVVIVPDPSQSSFPVLNRITAKMPFSNQQR